MVEATVVVTPQSIGIDCWPPTEDELPYEDGWVPESNVHQANPVLLQETLHHRLEGVREAFIGVNMFVYYSPNQVRTNDFLGPDFFVVLDQPMAPHKSWVVWDQDGRAPNVVIEMLSDSTAAVDKGKKLRAYQDHLRVPEYYLYDPWTAELTGYRLVSGVYQPIPVEPDGSLRCHSLGLKLVRWEGTVNGLFNTWLRWATLDGELLPTKDERTAAATLLAEQARLRAEEERIRAERERARAEQEQQTAERERARAEAAETEIARLRRLLEESGQLPADA